MAGHEVKWDKFDRAKLNALIEARKAAILGGINPFTFDGEQWDVDYAKYVIEYLEKRLGAH